MTCKLEAVEGDVYKISYTGDLLAKRRYNYGERRNENE